MNRKTIALFLALLMSLSTAAGCSDAGTQETTADTAAETAAVETETERPYADLPETDMGGADMTILVGYNEEKWPPDTVGVSKNEFFAPELTGEAVNDARYNRNQLLDERFCGPERNVQQKRAARRHDQDCGNTDPGR